MNGTILVVDDNKSILSALKFLLQKNYKTVLTLSSPNQIISSLQSNSIDVVLLDMNFSAQLNTGNEGLFWLGEIKNKYPDIQVVVFTAYAEISLAVEAIKRGATDFVVKPWNNEKLIATLNNAYNLKRSKTELRSIKEYKNNSAVSDNIMWGTSDIMKSLHNTILKVAPTDANILITGENGTGKDLIANEIHRLSKRSEELFVKVDVGALTETLFESELFGHIKGAFTDAKTDRAGKFEMANNGTLFLDEIGNIPIYLQSKLLNAIQSNRIERIGSNIPITTNVRLICATNRDLPDMVSKCTFREDLLFRINTINVHIPALRSRSEDIIPLAELFLKQYSQKYDKVINGFTFNAMTELKQYKWPGNIRELQHTIEKGVILCDSHTICSENLFLNFHCNNINNTSASTPSIDKTQSTVTLEEVEKQTIMAAIINSEGNMSAVAQKLGITRQTLYNKIKKYNL